MFESEEARKNYEEHPAHMDLREERLAVWIGDAAESALGFDKPKASTHAASANVRFRNIPTPSRQGVASRPSH